MTATQEEYRTITRDNTVMRMECSACDYAVGRKEVSDFSFQTTNHAPRGAFWPTMKKLMKKHIQENHEQEAAQ